jgi:hypothetical protein
VTVDPALADEVERLRVEIQRERERRVAAEALAAERKATLEHAARSAKPHRRSRRLTSHKLQGNWLPGVRRY